MQAMSQPCLLQQHVGVYTVPDGKIYCRYNLVKQLGIATLSLEKDGFTLEPSLKYDVEKQQPHPILAISQKKGADTLKAAYDIDGETGTLEWIHKPYKVGSGSWGDVCMFKHHNLR